jgi:hypothetical protein
MVLILMKSRKPALAQARLCDGCVNSAVELNARTASAATSGEAILFLVHLVELEQQFTQRHDGKDRNDDEEVAGHRRDASEAALLWQDKDK